MEKRLHFRGLLLASRALKDFRGDDPGDNDTLNFDESIQSYGGF